MSISGARATGTSGGVVDFLEEQARCGGGGSGDINGRISGAFEEASELIERDLAFADFHQYADNAAHHTP